VFSINIPEGKNTS